MCLLLVVMVVNDISIGDENKSKLTLLTLSQLLTWSQLFLLYDYFMKLFIIDFVHLMYYKYLSCLYFAL